MKQLFLITFFFLKVLFSGAIAQEFSITGFVLDENNQQLSYVNVLLKHSVNSDKTLGTSTDEKGFFTINNISPGNYILSASFLGFETFSKSIEVNKDIALGNIILKESAESLSEVEVVVKKPTLKREVDRLVFNVANTSLSEGNMMEVLRGTPGVLVLDNSIFIKNGIPTVYINDRKVNLSADELATLLESSPANSIKSVEVITNPPAKYDAESGAVLNIVMSKNLITGYRGNVFTNYSQGNFPRYNTGLANFFKNNKISLYANYSFTQNKERRKNKEEINFLDNLNEIDEVWQSNFHRITRFKTHNFNFNLDYFINKNNTISIASNMLLLPYFRFKTNSHTDVLDPSFNPNFNFNSNSLSLDDKHNLGFDLDYVFRLNDKAKLSFNGHATFYDYSRDQNVNSEYFNTTIPDTRFSTFSNQDTEIYSGQVDYELQTKNSSSISAGIKTSNIKINSDITRFDSISGEEILNTDLSDAFNYDENIYAAYFSYNKTWEKWSLSTGLRLEQTKTEGVSLTNNAINNQDYLKLFPTFNLSHQLSEKVEIYTNYKKSVNRPKFQDLNPFRLFLNDNTITTGNPRLLPSFVDHVVIGSSINNTFTFEAYYKYSDGWSIQLPIQDNDNNLLVYTPTNLANSLEYGFDFVTYLTPTKNWQLYFVASLYNIQDEAVFGGDKFKSNTWSGYSELTNSVSFLKDNSLTAALTLLYIGENQQGFQKLETIIGSSFSLKKTLLENKATLSLYVADIFNEEDQFVTLNFLNQNNSRLANVDNRYIKLGFSYKFGNTTLETNDRLKENEERNRIIDQN